MGRLNHNSHEQGCPTAASLGHTSYRKDHQMLRMMMTNGIMRENWRAVETTNLTQERRRSGPEGVTTTWAWYGG